MGLAGQKEVEKALEESWDEAVEEAEEKTPQKLLQFPPPSCTVPSAPPSLLPLRTFFLYSAYQKYFQLGCVNNAVGL